MNKSTRTIGIDSKAGRKSRTGSTVTMGVSDLEAIEAQQYFMAIQAGEEPTGRIKKIELIMYSEDDLKEVVELPSTEELEKAITIEDVIIEQDEETYNLDVFLENERLTPNQGHLPLYKKDVLKCERCTMNIDGSFCDRECMRNPNSKSNIDLFEIIPMSQRL